MSRLGSFALVFGAALADHVGAHPLAFYALLAAVPLAAYAGLQSVAERRESAAYVWALVLCLLLVATAARAPAVGDTSVPAVSRSALIACVVVFCAQALAALAAELRTGR
jgi:predicted nicotinamide N-methyase